MRKVLQEEAQWFANWTLSQSMPPISSTYKIVIPHGENTVDFSRKIPIQGPTFADTDFLISPEQARALDNLLLGHIPEDTPCCLAMYTGYMHTAWGEKDGFDEPEATWIFGRLNYALFRTRLAGGLFGATARRWEGVLTEQSYLWDEKHSWFIAAPPDMAGTVVGTENPHLAEALLNERRLRAVPVPGGKMDWLE